MNTLALVNAGIMKADGTVLKKEDDIRSGEIVMGADGTPTGYPKEQADTYVRSFLDVENLFSIDIAKTIMPQIEQQLLSEGYTMYTDGWSNYFYNTNFYEAAQQQDQAGDLHFILGTTYEIESWMNVDEVLAKASNAKKYASTRVKRKDEMRNTLVHVRNVDTAEYQRMADHNIYVAAGLLWHILSTEVKEMMKGLLPASLEDKSFPMKSFFNHGINVSSHSDYPALSGSPDDPFGIMEIAVTGVHYYYEGDPWWTEELLSREQVLTALTINCAKQMFIEEERGSIKTGKFADFLLVDKDVLTCPVTEIHAAKPEATFFEGKKVFAKP